MYKIVVCAKQVPDTENITGEAMTAEGTVNRAALPAVFNPEDLKALETALRVKDEHGAHVTVITMGPPKAAEILRDSLYRGCDEAVLLTDMKFAASDTLATSYVLACAVRKVVPQFDMVLCGSQAIDGDTGQVGPQLAEKLGVPQVTYVESLEVEDGVVRAKRVFPTGYEVVESGMPVLITVGATGPDPRPANAYRLMQYKKARAPVEVDEETAASLAEKGLLIRQMGAEDLGVEAEQCGMKGSPTRVVKIENVVLAKTETKQVPATKEGIFQLITELREEHII